MTSDVSPITNPDFDSTVSAGIRCGIEQLSESPGIDAVKFVIYGGGGYEVTVTRLPKPKADA